VALVLASASPRRSELLPALGVPFEVEPADVDEAGEDPDAARLACALALRKARAVAARRPSDVVIGADTIVVLDGRRLGKPRDAAEARAMLEALRGRSHEVVTGVAVLAGARGAAEAARTAVTMRAYGDAEIARYIARGEPFDKAGGYAIQDAELAPAAAIEGCRCAVIGLPLWTLRGLLREVAGVAARPPELPPCPDCPHREA
jgi:MAF protein